MIARPALTAASTSRLRDELAWLRARHDGGALSDATLKVIRDLERDIAWREHAQALLAEGGVR
jgi:hypothetical protein